MLTAVVVLALLLAGGSLGSRAQSSGTTLTVSASATGEDVCVDGVATVTVTYTVTSSAAADGATGSFTVTDGDGNVVNSGSLPEIDSGVAPAGGWTHNPPGSAKTAGGQFQLSLGNGTYDIEVCFEQHGAEKKSDCTTITVTVNCGAAGCDRVAQQFGQVMGNTNLCSQLARINVQVKGPFGSSAQLEVKNPNGTVMQVVNKNRGEGSDDRCVYVWQLNPKDWPSTLSGVYSFHVSSNDSGNTSTLDFGATLDCKKSGKP